MTTVNQVIDNIKQLPGYLVHFKEISKQRDGHAMIFIDYTLRIGATNDCVDYSKKYVVLNYGTDSESCYLVKATPTIIVKTRKWT